MSDDKQSTYDALMQKKNERLLIGLTIIIILFVLTIGEFMLGEVGANTGGWRWVFILIAVTKSFMVVREYMHVRRVFAPAGEEH